MYVNMVTVVEFVTVAVRIDKYMYQHNQNHQCRACMWCKLVIEAGQSLAIFVAKVKNLNNFVHLVTRFEFSRHLKSGIILKICLHFGRKN